MYFLFIEHCPDWQLKRFFFHIFQTVVNTDCFLIKVNVESGILICSIHFLPLGVSKITISCRVHESKRQLHETFFVVITSAFFCSTLSFAKKKIYLRDTKRFSTQFICISVGMQTWIIDMDKKLNFSELDPSCKQFRDYLFLSYLFILLMSWLQFFLSCSLVIQ